MKKFLALVLALVMVFTLTACSGGSGGKGDSIKIGAILIGDENEGYTYAHIEGILQAAKALGIDTETNVIFKYNTPEDEKCYDAALDLAEQGCDVIFANSFGHETYLKEVAAEYPDIYFCHATGTGAQTSGLENFCNYFDNSFEARYVSGIVAGLKLKELMDSGEVTDPRIGYVGAYPFAEVISGYTSFFLGIRSIVPDAYMDVIFTNSWFDIVAEGAAAQSLIANGAVIICQHSDSTGAPAAVQAALDSGTTAYAVGYNIDMLAVAPTAALTSAQHNWQFIYKQMLQVVIDGGKLETDYCGGYADNAVQISKLGPSCAEGTAKAVEDAIAGIKAGTLHVFDTNTFTVDGKKVTSAFATDTDGDWTNDADEAIIDGYYHESYFRSAPSFSLNVDGINIIG